VKWLGDVGINASGTLLSFLPKIDFMQGTNILRQTPNGTTKYVSGGVQRMPFTARVTLCEMGILEIPLSFSNYLNHIAP
jgi:hypothetical protein